MQVDSANALATEAVEVVRDLLRTVTTHPGETITLNLEGKSFVMSYETWAEFTNERKFFCGNCEEFRRAPFSADYLCEACRG